jgi:thioredoxin 1
MATPVSDAEFGDKVLKSPIPVLVDFWAPWCGPCKAMLPIIDELTAQYDGKLSVVKMNVDENTDVPGKYNVMSIPTFLLVKGGEVVESFVGTKSKEDMQKKIDLVLAA